MICKPIYHASLLKGFWEYWTASDEQIEQYGLVPKCKQLKNEIELAILLFLPIIIGIIIFNTMTLYDRLLTIPIVIVMYSIEFGIQEYRMSKW